MTPVQPAVFIINSLEGGGAEGVMCKLLAIMESWFREQNRKVYLLLLDEAEEAHSCPDYVHKETLFTDGSLMQGYSALQQRLKKLQPEYCVSFLTRANMLNIVLAKRLGYRSIISERVNTSSHFSGGVKDKVSKLMVRASYPFADRVIAVSAGVKADLVRRFGVSALKVDTIYNPYDITAINKLADDIPDDLPSRPYIIGTGRLVPNKNFSLMIQAYAKAKINEDLLILGQGAERDRLQALAGSLGVADRVHFAGFKTNPYPYLKSARYFVSTSNAEGFPNAIVEAMCLGRPVVATNCESGPAEILTGDYPVDVKGFTAGQYGALCELNEVNGVAEAMQYMSDDIHQEEYQYRSSSRARDFSNTIFKAKIISAIYPEIPPEGNTYVRAG